MLPFYLQDLDPSAYLREPSFTLDLETTNLSFGDSRIPQNRIVMAAAQHEGQRAQIIDTRLREVPRRGILVAHNAKFELGWLIRLGVDVSDLLVWDTMIAEYVLAGNRQVPLDLDSVCRRYGLPGKERIIAALMEGGVCPSEMPEHLLRQRVLRDVETTTQLYYLQRKILHEEGLLPVMFTRCITTTPLAYIERKGMTLDATRVREETMRAREEKAVIERDIAEMSGGINLRSGKQMAAFLYDKLQFPEPKDRRGNTVRTASGRPKTDKATLESLKATTEEQKRFVELRNRFGKVDSALSKSLEFFYGVCEEYGGKFFGNFNQCRTKTHRLSSSGRRIVFADGTERGVQLQNLPREYKPMFQSSDPDKVIVEADGSGLEFRIAADLCMDPVARADILDPNHDPHTFTAMTIYRKAADAVSKKLRTAAKRHTFKPLFSTGKSGTKDEVRYYQEFKQRYSRITEVQESWIAEVLRNGFLRLASGLRVYWDLVITPTGYIEGGNEVRNLPIQSFATADIIPVSLVYTFWRSRHALDCDIINTVHDSVVAEVAKKDVDKYRAVVLQSFLDDTPKYLKRVYGHSLFVPLGVGITIGSHWGEGEEESHEMEGIAA